MASSTLLELCQNFARRMSLPVPTTVVNSTDETTLQLWTILDEEVEDLADRFNWKELTFRTTFVHANGPDYLAKAIDDFVPPLKYPLKDTLWSVDLRIPVNGPLNPQQWTQMLSLNVQPAQYCFRWAQTGVWIYPVPPIPADPGLGNFVLEYVASTPCFDPGGGGYQESYISDATYSLLPDRLIKAGLLWRYRAAKGFPYAEDQRKYEDLIAGAEARNGNAPTLRMDAGDTFPEVISPGLLVPAGNWNQP